MRYSPKHFGPLAFCIFFLTGCTTTYQNFSQELQNQVDPNLTFSRIKESPLDYQGKMVMVGGEILVSKRLKDQTKLTVLELPLLDSQEPNRDRTRSEGRFIAFQKEFLDPATVPEGTRVTLIGEVTGKAVEMLDEMEYTYPTIIIKQLKVWPKSGIPPYWAMAYPYGPYWYGRYWGPYFGPYGIYGPYYPYYYPYYWW